MIIVVIGNNGQFVDFSSLIRLREYQRADAAPADLLFLAISLVLTFNVQRVKILGLSQPSRKAEWEKIKAREVLNEISSSFLSRIKEIPRSMSSWDFFRNSSPGLGFFLYSTSRAVLLLSLAKYPSRTLAVSL